MLAISSLSQELINSLNISIVLLRFGLRQCFNPIELVFGLLKTHLRNRYTVSPACTEHRARSEEELKVDLEYAASQITVSEIAGFFRERGTERAFRQFYPDIQL
jgi:hypothetical protein